MNLNVIGYQKSTFKTKDDKIIEGYNIHCMYPILTDKGEGNAVERIYMTVGKLIDCDYAPQVGDEIRVNYNRYGKPASIERVS